MFLGLFFGADGGVGLSTLKMNDAIGEWTKTRVPQRWNCAAIINSWRCSQELDRNLYRTQFMFKCARIDRAEALGSRLYGAGGANNAKSALIV